MREAHLFLDTTRTASAAQRLRCMQDTASTGRSPGTDTGEIQRFEIFTLRFRAVLVHCSS